MWTRLSVSLRTDIEKHYVSLNSLCFPMQVLAKYHYTHAASMHNQHTGWWDTLEGMGSTPRNKSKISRGCMHLSSRHAQWCCLSSVRTTALQKNSKRYTSAVQTPFLLYKTFRLVCDHPFKELFLSIQHVIDSCKKKSDPSLCKPMDNKKLGEILQFTKNGKLEMGSPPSSTLPWRRSGTRLFLSCTAIVLQ